QRETARCPAVWSGVTALLLCVRHLCFVPCIRLRERCGTWCLCGEIFMTLTVHLFARARELAGADAVSAELRPGSTVADVKRALAERFPALAALLLVSAIAVNHDFAENSRVIAPSDELAIIPPVSGG